MPDRKLPNDQWADYVAKQITAEVYDESRYTPETRRIMDEHDQRMRRDDPMCPLCDEPVHGEAAQHPLYTEDGPKQVHWQCMLRSTLGGIGHLIAHEHWCGAPRHDPDAGLTYRQSALLTAAWVRIVGYPQTEEEHSAADHTGDDG